MIAVQHLSVGREHSVGGDENLLTDQEKLLVAEQILSNGVAFLVMQAG